MHLTASPAWWGCLLYVNVIPAPRSRGTSITGGRRHHLFNQDSHGLINVLVFLDRRLHPARKAVFFAEAIHFFSCHCPRGKVTFVSQQQAGHGAPVWQRQFAVQVLLPLLAVAEGADVGDIEHDDAGGCLPVVQPRH